MVITIPASQPASSRAVPRHFQGAGLLLYAKYCGVWRGGLATHYSRLRMEKEYEWPMKGE